MNTLQLIIKGVFLDQILTGEKKIETRDIRPANAKKYVIETPDSVTPRPYDAIEFFAGYNKNRKTAVVKVEGAEVVVLTNEEGEELIYEHEGEEYAQAIIEYKLGNILSHN